MRMVIFWEHHYADEGFYSGNRTYRSRRGLDSVAPYSAGAIVTETPYRAFVRYGNSPALVYDETFRSTPRGAPWGTPRSMKMCAYNSSNGKWTIRHFDASTQFQVCNGLMIICTVRFRQELLAELSRRFARRSTADAVQAHLIAVGYQEHLVRYEIMKYLRA